VGELGSDFAGVACTEMDDCGAQALPASWTAKSLSDPLLIPANSIVLAQP